jgi:SNF2 family DNA or RNA helicase
MAITQREHALEEFRSATEPRILLMSLKAGGVGLNLVKANLVISLGKFLQQGYNELEQRLTELH